MSRLDGVSPHQEESRRSPSLPPPVEGRGEEEFIITPLLCSLPAQSRGQRHFAIICRCAEDCTPYRWPQQELSALPGKDRKAGWWQHIQHPEKNQIPIKSRLDGVSPPPWGERRLLLEYSWNFVLQNPMINRMTKILVTGGDGLLAYALRASCRRAIAICIFFRAGEFDLTAPDQMEAQARRAGPASGHQYRGLQSGGPLRAGT